MVCKCSHGSDLLLGSIPVNTLKHGSIVGIGWCNGNNENSARGRLYSGAAELVVHSGGCGEHLFDGSDRERVRLLIEDHRNGGLRKPGSGSNVIHGNAFVSHNNLLKGATAFDKQKAGISHGNVRKPPKGVIRQSGTAALVKFSIA